MNKKINYKRLFEEMFQILSPKRNIDSFWTWLIKDVPNIENKPYQITRDLNFRICSLLINPNKKIEKELDKKMTKILCNIMDLPYDDNQKKTIKQINLFIINNPNKLREIFIKYLNLMNYEVMSCFHMECLKFGNGEKDGLPNKFYWDEKNKTGKKYFKKNDKNSVINTEMAKLHMNRELLNLFNINLNRISSFDKDKVNKGWEANKIYEKFITVYSGILSSDNISKEIDDLTKDIFADTNNIYKFSVDKNYNLDKSGLGGPYHRLHDESHSLHEMAKKVKDALPNDSNITEIIAFINEFAKDVQTTMGIPIISVKKETFDNMHSFLKPLGINKNDLYDFLTYNLQEVLNVCFIIAFYLFPSTRKNKEKLGNVYGLLTVTGTFGNPLALIILALTLITSVIKNDFKNKEDKKELLKGAAKSAGLTLIIKFAIGFFDIDSIGKLIGFFVGIAVVIILYKKGVKKVEINKFKKEVEKEIDKLSKKSKFILEQTKLIEMQ